MRRQGIRAERELNQRGLKLPVPEERGWELRTWARERTQTWTLQRCHSPGDLENEPRQAKPGVPRAAPGRCEGTERGPLSHSPAHAFTPRAVPTSYTGATWEDTLPGAAPSCLRSGERTAALPPSDSATTQWPGPGWASRIWGPVEGHPQIGSGSQKSLSPFQLRREGVTVRVEASSQGQCEYTWARGPSRWNFICTSSRILSGPAARRV